MSVVGTSDRRVWVQAATGPELPGDAGDAPGRLVSAPQPVPGEHPWDEAHRLIRDPVAFEFDTDTPVYAEPDLMQEFPHERAIDSAPESFSAPPCAERAPDSFWPVGTPDIGWHLNADHSGLKAAREKVGDAAGRRIRIGLLDTGYDPNHETLPLHLRIDLGRNFAGGDPNDTTDPGRYSPLNQPGHGTATAALLAGRRVALPGGFNDFLGGAPHAEVVPIRIADSVVHFRTSSMAAGIDYAVEKECDVVSISMGGVPTRAWARAVNRAYEAGMVIVAAAGNRFGPSPPSSIVYPARFGRVLAACGVTADGSPYYRAGLHRHMQGCFGPESKMTTALAAPTPNTPWAIMGCARLVGFGGGTSSATPQIAAAAALWLQTASIPPNVEPWQKVEAVRWALFSRARKDLPDSERYFGQGVVRARAALEVPFAGDLPKAPTDSVSFPWLRSIGILEALPPEPAGTELMYEVEALQVYLQSPYLQELAGGTDPHADSLSRANFRKLIAAIRSSPAISRSLRDHLSELQRRLAPVPAPSP